MAAKTIGIISIKGGVGKTSLVSSLGASLAHNFNKKVLVVDANFSAPNLGLHLGLINPDITLHHVLSDKAEPEEAVYESEHGFHILPGAMIYSQINPFKLKSALKELKNYYDLIIIDSSPAMDNDLLAAMVASDELYIVTTPDYVTLATTLRAVKFARQKKTPINGIILNKVYGANFELSIEDIEKTADCPVLAVLPHETEVLEALSKQTPSSIYKNTKSSREIKELAAALIGEKPIPDLLSKIQNYFGIIPRQEANRALFSQERKI